MTGAENMPRVKAFLFFFLALVFLLWVFSNRLQAGWAGVPPVPTRQGAVMMMLGDEQFSFRFGALTLQNLGDGGGRVTPIKDYDFDKLGKWFWLLNSLDPASEHVPLITAFYFGGAPEPSQVKVVVDYLAYVGNNPAGEKWRWLAHAAYLALHKMKDPDLALDLAYRLSKIQPLSGELPGWAKQMPAFILKKQGQIESAREFFERVFVEGGVTNANEINFMRAWLVEQGGMSEAEVDALDKKRALRAQTGMGTAEGGE